MIQQLNQILESHGAANEGTNHVSDYAVVKLPDTDSIAESLDVYFSGIHTSVSPPQPAKNWHIKTSLINEPETTLRSALSHWLYNLEYSPKTPGNAREGEIAQIFNLIAKLARELVLYEILVTPPLWYDCVWQDFAIDGTEGRWLLHFGFSD